MRSYLQEGGRLVEEPRRPATAVLIPLPVPRRDARGLRSASTHRHTRQIDRRDVP